MSAVVLGNTALLEEYSRRQHGASWTILANHFCEILRIFLALALSAALSQCSSSGQLPKCTSMNLSGVERGKSFFVS